MNYITKLITFLLLLLIITEVSGQVKMTMEEWKKHISEYTSLKFELTAKIIKLQNENLHLQTALDEKTVNLKKSEDEYWLMVGGKDNYKAYKKKLDQLLVICKNREGKMEDAEKMFMELDTYLKCHPDLAPEYEDIRIRLDNAKYRKNADDENEDKIKK